MMGKMQEMWRTRSKVSPWEKNGRHNKYTVNGSGPKQTAPLNGKVDELHLVPVLENAPGGNQVEEVHIVQAISGKRMQQGQKEYLTGLGGDGGGLGGRDPVL